MQMKNIESMLEQIEPTIREDLFGYADIPQIIQRYKKSEQNTTQIEAVVLAYLAAQNIGRIARKAADKECPRSLWGIVMNWEHGIYKLIMADGDMVLVDDKHIEYFDNETNLRDKTMRDVVSILNRINTTK